MKKILIGSLSFLNTVLFVTVAAAATPRITLRTGFSSGKSSFSLKLTAANLPSNNCKAAVYGSNSSLQLSRDPSLATRLFEVKVSALPLELKTSDIEKLQRASSARSSTTNIYFRARLQCSSSKRYSAIEHETFKTVSRGGKSLTTWIKKLGSAVKQGTQSPPLATPTPTVTPTLGTLRVTTAFPSLSFTSPLYFTSAHDGSGRNFVVQKGGQIYAFNNSSQTTTKTLFLDIASRINTSGERGLLSVAFHPNFPRVPYLYVYYVAPDGSLTISRFTAGANPAVADPNTELVLLTVPHSENDNHNGGQLQFGPDGYLYAGIGDGGGGGDPHGNGQSVGTLLGKILRINVDVGTDGHNYSIPTTNPFFNDLNARKEIYAYGLRNPWRFSFDSLTSVLWAGDVGQDNREEVDIIENGKNYGWNITEGTACYPSSTSCDKSGITAPVTDYDHTVGQSITGGYVYRGSAIPSLKGYYVYGDFVTGKIFVLLKNNDSVAVKQVLDTSLSISSFGVDESNELYIVNYNGSIYRFALAQ